MVDLAGSEIAARKVGGAVPVRGPSSTSMVSVLALTCPVTSWPECRQQRDTVYRVSMMTSKELARRYTVIGDHHGTGGGPAGRAAVIHPGLTQPAG
ncbi:hypothetical protein EDD27_0694 [Nonomuraea polychroma]|uniref:Uncharacterized protein n=1 Tax=Nonomuraea polychroma TaxID=46176 RepID=A0A438LXZ2_9ACTN|nr:hypothetical protein [Nonomuraea polychroma]RVX38389.1 hypothetical protein EDD27_0694 [Nonomuraea polychroma]